MKYYFFFLICVSAFFIGSEARVMGKCEFANLLRSWPWLIKPEDIPTWTCIANYESHFDTNARNWQSGDHGIYQISEKWWCNNWDQPGKGCNKKCSDFRNDDIYDDTECVKKIYDEGHGFGPWATYWQYCNNPNIVNKFRC